MSLDEWNRIFEKGIKDLMAFQPIDRLDEVIIILKELRHNEFFKDLANMDIEGENCLLDSRNVWECRYDNGSFYSMGKEELKSRAPIYLPPLTNFVLDTSFSAMYANLESSYVYDSGHKLTDKEIKSFIFGDIGQCVTFFVEDFDKPGKLPTVSSAFFKRLKNVYWENKKAKKLDYKIYDTIGTITAENSTPSIFNRTFGHCNSYLEACNALKYDRDVVTCEDVVVAYLTNFKILMTDIRPLVPLLNIE